MKKMLNVILMMVTIVAISSCGSSRGLYGKGEGISTDRTIAMEKAKINALGEIAEKDGSTVDKVSVIEKAESNGIATETFTQTTTVESHGIYKDLGIDMTIYKGVDGRHHARARIKAKRDKKSERAEKI